MLRPAIISTRVSTVHQEEGYSLQTQLEQCRRYAEANGFTVVAEFQDIKSGTTLDRSGLTEARRMLQKGEAVAILVYSPDRLTRSIAHAVLLREEFRRYGAELHSVTRGLVGDSAEDSLTANIEAVFAEYWREKIAEATQRGKRAKVLSGKFPGYGHAPYGYQIVGVKREACLEVMEQEARIVRLIYQWYAYGDEGGVPLTIFQVAQKLSELGIASPADGGNRGKLRPLTVWNVTTIHRILRHAAYKGIYYAYRYKKVGNKLIRTPPEEWIPVAVPAIVDEQVWTAAQCQMDAQRCESKRNTQQEYLLRGHVKCGCGYTMHCKTCNSKDSRNGVRYIRLFYRCHGGTNRATRICPYKSKHFSAKKVDAAVWQWIATTLLDEQAIYDGYNQIEAQSAGEIELLGNQRSALAAQYEETRRQLERLLDLYLSGAFDKSILEQRKEALQKTLRALEEELGSVDGYLTDQTAHEDDLKALLLFAEQVSRAIPELTFEQKRHLVEILDVRATLTVEDGARVVYVVSRIDRARLPLDGKQGNNSSEPPEATSSSQESDFGLQALTRS